MNRGYLYWNTFCLLLQIPQASLADEPITPCTPDNSTDIAITQRTFGGSVSCDGVDCYGNAEKATADYQCTDTEFYQCMGSAWAYVCAVSHGTNGGGCKYSYPPCSPDCEGEIPSQVIPSVKLYSCNMNTCIGKLWEGSATRHANEPNPSITKIMQSGPYLQAVARLNQAIQVQSQDRLTRETANRNFLRELEAAAQGQDGDLTGNSCEDVDSGGGVLLR